MQNSRLINVSRGLIDMSIASMGFDIGAIAACHISGYCGAVTHLNSSTRRLRGLGHWFATFSAELGYGHFSLAFGALHDL